MAKKIAKNEHEKKKNQVLYSMINLLSLSYFVF
jgi:hypothetical protein